MKPIPYLKFFLLAAALNCEAFAAASPDNLISWWSAEGNALEKSDFFRPDSVENVEFVPGRIGKAFYFKGNNSRISIRDSSALKITNSLTIQGWLRVSSFPGFQGVILFRGDDRCGLDPYAVMTKPNGVLAFEMDNESGQRDSISIPVKTNEWFHFAAIFDEPSSAMRLFINGDLAVEKITTIRPFANLDPAHNPAVGIGNHGGSYWDFSFHGAIDELSLWSRSFSAEEILSSFKAALNRPSSEPQIVATPSVQSAALAISSALAIKAIPLRNGNVRIEFAGVSGKNYIVQVSNDLTNWQTMGTPSDLGHGAFSLDDAAASTLQARFYRVINR